MASSTLRICTRLAPSPSPVLSPPSPCSDERAGAMARAWTLLLVTILCAGCATTPYSEGQSALQKGRYVEAEGYFTQALAADPGRPDALVGLGIAQYKQGEIDQASDTLE